MKINNFYRGDCIDVLSGQIDERSVNLIFADPPYNLSGTGLKWEGNKTGGDWYMVNESWDKMSDSDYITFTKQWISACHRVLTDNGSVYISCTYHNIAEIIMALKGMGFRINNVITWQKSNAMPNMTKRVFTHSTEFVVWAVKGKKWIFNYNEIKEINPDRQKDGSIKQMRDVWSLPLVQGKERIRGENGRALHPTQKPEEMLKRIIIASSKEGDLVLDPFMGSGTTAVVAESLNRRWIGIEKEQKYIDMAIARVQKIKLGGENMGKNQHVVKTNDGWGVRGEGNSRITSEHRTKNAAENAGRQIAKHQQSELVIHGRDGKIQDKDSFGKDPCPPKDRKH